MRLGRFIFTPCALMMFAARSIGTSPWRTRYAPSGPLAEPVAESSSGADHAAVDRGAVGSRLGAEHEDPATRQLCRFEDGGDGPRVVGRLVHGRARFERQQVERRAAVHFLDRHAGWSASAGRP